MSTRIPNAPNADAELADDGGDEQRRGQPDDGWPGHRRDVGIEADLHEEHRDEQVRGGSEVALDPGVLLAPADRQPGDESADDRREVGPLGGPREQQHERERQYDDGRRRSGVALHLAERHRHDEHADDGGHDEEADRAADRAKDRQRIDVASGDNLDDHREDDQSEDVVGNGRAEHDSSLGGGERLEVAEHPGRDSHARGGEGGTEEQCGVARFTETESDEPADHEWHHDADNGHRHRRPADATEFGEVHLHADLHQQQQHTQFGECGDGLAVRWNPPEQRGSDQDSDDDLADDSRHSDSLAQLGRDLGGEQNHRDVEQHPGIVRMTASSCLWSRVRGHTPETNW